LPSTRGRDREESWPLTSTREREDSLPSKCQRERGESTQWRERGEFAINKRETERG